MTLEEFTASLKTRLANPAVSDSELVLYVEAAQRDVTVSLYTPADYISQVLDTACYLLSLDNKFPEVSSVNQNGVSSSFAPNDPERWRRRISERRQSSLIGWDV